VRVVALVCVHGVVGDALTTPTFGMGGTVRAGAQVALDAGCAGRNGAATRPSSVTRQLAGRSGDALLWSSASHVCGGASRLGRPSLTVRSLCSLCIGALLGRAATANLCFGAAHHFFLFPCVYG